MCLAFQRRGGLTMQGRFTTDNHWYTGKDSGKREYGDVAVILDKETARAFIGFNPVSSRIITVKLQCHPFNLTIIQVYARLPQLLMKLWKSSMASSRTQLIARGNGRLERKSGEVSTQIQGRWNFWTGRA